MPRPAATPRRHVCLGALAIAGLVSLSACSGSSAPAAEAAGTTAPVAATVPTTEATTAPPTSGAPTTAAPTTAAPTTAAPTTTTPTVAAPTVPITVPADSDADEPVILMGSLSIPKIGVDMAMYEGVRMTTLELGPGHWPGTALPGEVGNVVVAGHRTSKHKVFRNIDQLVEGDELIFTDPDGAVHTYSVTSTQIVQPTDVWIVNPTDTATATLFACHPPGSTAQRIVVFADLVHE